MLVAGLSAALNDAALYAFASETNRNAYFSAPLAPARQTQRARIIRLRREILQHCSSGYVRSKLKCPLFVACEMSGFKVVPSPSGPGWFWGWGCRGRGQSLFPCLVL